MKDQVNNLTEIAQEPVLDRQAELDEMQAQHRQLEEWQARSARKIDQLHMQRVKACDHLRHRWPRS